MTRHRPADPVEPLGGLGSEPGGGAISRSTRDYVDQLAVAHVDDRGAPDLGAPLSLTPEQRFSSTPTAWTSPIRSVSASNRASPQRTTSLFTVCQSQPSSAATSSTERPRRPTWTVTHLAARDVNNARWGPIVGSCSTNDLIAHSGFGHVQRRFRHRSRTGRPNAGKSTNTTAPIALRPHRPATCDTQRAGLAGTEHHLQRCTAAAVVDPDQINIAQTYQQFAHARRINFHRGPPASDVAYQHPIMEDPPSLLVDYHSPWQIPSSPLISEEPLYRLAKRPWLV